MNAKEALMKLECSVKLEYYMAPAAADEIRKACIEYSKSKTKIDQKKTINSLTNAKPPKSGEGLK